VLRAWYGIYLDGGLRRGKTHTARVGVNRVRWTGVRRCQRRSGKSSSELDQLAGVFGFVECI